MLNSTELYWQRNHVLGRPDHAGAQDPRKKFRWQGLCRIGIDSHLLICSLAASLRLAVIECLMGDYPRLPFHVCFPSSLRIGTCLAALGLCVGLSATAVGAWLGRRTGARMCRPML